MKLSEFRNILENNTEINILQADGLPVPQHFHLTEAGVTTKHFIDCGGTERIEKHVSFQLWVAADYDHRLHPEKLLKIIDMAAPIFNNEDLEVEVEYQAATIGRYGLAFNGTQFQLTPKQTDCLAQDQCGIPQAKPKVQLATLQNQTACTPGSGCC